ncbi:hypothetical protein, partial [Alistipes shahii]|uniref:hypothetical protein n=1 Tax=Alistipes shahii TaxID=328814 RepID=UPI003AADAC79
AAIRLNSSKNSVKLRHYHVEYHRIRYFFMVDPVRKIYPGNRNRATVAIFRSHSCCGNYIAGGRSVYNMCRPHIPIPSAGGRSAGAIRMR